MTQIENLFKELENLHHNYDVIWTLGSGEARNKLYIGHALPINSPIWADVSLWFASDDLEEILELMVRSARSTSKAASPRFKVPPGFANDGF